MRFIFQEIFFYDNLTSGMFVNEKKNPPANLPKALKTYIRVI